MSIDEDKMSSSLQEKMDLEAQLRRQKRPSKVLKTDILLVVCLIASLLFLSYVFIVPLVEQMTHSQRLCGNADSSLNPPWCEDVNVRSTEPLPSQLGQEIPNPESLSRPALDTVPVTNKNTLMVLEPPKNPIRPIKKSGAPDADINDEYKLIVLLAPVIIISWDDDTQDIPVSTTLTNRDTEDLMNGGSISNPSLQEETVSDYETSRTLKTLLTKNYQILPQPQILSINKHPHYLKLIGLIMQKVEKMGISKKSNFLPGLIINGRPVASAKLLEQLHASGKLLDYLKSWGEGVISVEKA